MSANDWTPIGEILGQTLFGRCARYNELGTPECEFLVRSDRAAVYTLVSSDQYPNFVYHEEGDPESFFEPNWYHGVVYPEKITLFQGWLIYPPTVPGERPGIALKGGSAASKNRPPRPDFSAPETVEALDKLALEFRASLPEREPRVDLYRMCEGDNPALLRAE